MRIGERDAPSLDMHRTVSFLTQNYASFVYDHLVTFPFGADAAHPYDERILPGLAERWETSSDGKTITFHLRRGATFHNKPPVDGREVTAEDVVYSLERFARLSGFRGNFAPVERIEAVDSHTVRLVTREPYAPLLSHLAQPSNAVVLPKEL